MNGLLLIDKPPGVTSHDAVSRLRRHTGIRRIGHAGTLDPFATGLLLLLFGRATRLSQFFTGMDKEYRVRVRLGQESDTFDITGKVIRERPVDVSYEQFTRILRDFLGHIEQVPPMFSAVKIRGRRLYELAREGQEVERPSRSVSIHCLKMLTPQQDWTASGPTREAEILVRCSSGTYIRSLVHDIGARLGCGALVSELHRTAAGSYQVEDALLLDHAGPDTIKANLIPMERLLQDIPSVTVSVVEFQRICHGQDLSPRPAVQQGWVRLLDQQENLVALGTVSQSGIHPDIVLV
jgi:tRNA pseudouridine55 synthase